MYSNKTLGVQLSRAAQALITQLEPSTSSFKILTDRTVNLMYQREMFVFVSM